MAEQIRAPDERLPVNHTEVPVAMFGFGSVWHQRSRPTSHQFRYRVFFVAVPAKLLVGPPSGNWLFGINRSAIISLSKECFDLSAGRCPSLPVLDRTSAQGVTLYSFARVFGYEFKPVSFWVSTQDVIAEVHNTFGERHVYVVPRAQPASAEKQFHVSPFCDVKGHYEFEIHDHSGRFCAAINYFDQDGDSALIKTRMSGKLAAVNLKTCLWAIFAYPMFSFAVIARIHWQALRLWLKKVPWFSKPVPPLNPLTHATNLTPKHDKS